MSKRAVVAVVVISVLSLGVVGAQSPAGPKETSEEFEAKLGYRTGIITLPGGLATIRMPESFRYIGPEGSRRLLTEAWGNPPGSAEGVLGMLVPADVSPLDKEGWGIVITYDEDGYVNDDDAASIDYTKMLKQMQDATIEANKEREKEGFDPVTVIGWAEPPSYDAAAHKLYWAKELAFGPGDEHTLNYNIRVLGRRGVLVLNAVANMGQLESIRGETKGILSAVDFNEGHRYTDYLPSTDKAATYGIAGLIVGATAAKAGFFKVLLVGILAFKKILVVGGIALLAALKKFFGSKTTTTAPAETPANS
jgi:uncharacterized membrane-anchored protein